MPNPFLGTKITQPHQILVVIMAVVCLVSSYSSAQTAPDAGSLQQQQRQTERDRHGKLPVQAPDDLSPRHEPRESAVTILVTEFAFEGNTLLTDEQLRTAVASFTHRQLDLTSLRQATAAVAEAYRKAGWVVRAYLPKQDVTSGQVVINIVEATLGQVKLEGMPPTRVKLEHVLGIVNHRITPGEPLNADGVDRGLLLADDLAGVRVFGSLEAGAQPGQTDLLVTAEDDPLLRGTFVVDNGGTRATGSIRGWADLSLDSPLHGGDQLSLTTIISEGSQYGSASYTLPIGYDGWEIGVNGSVLAYRLVASDFDNLDGEGDSFTLGLEAFYPLVRARNHNLQLLMNYDFRSFENQTLNVVQSDYHINEVTVALAGNWFEDLLGTSASNFGSLEIVVGDVDQGRLDPGENPGVAGTFTKIEGHISRQQELVSGLSLYIAFTGQASFGETLDSAERFYLGGPHSVRAYPVNEASGSSGLLTSLELRGQLPLGFNLIGFYDIGYIENDQSVGSSYLLQGGGVSLLWYSPEGFTVEATWAHRVDDNPNPAPNGDDQDGSFEKNRFWLSASFTF